jgi:antitoxin YefM
MVTTYRLSVNELSEEFIKSIKALYKNKVIDITIETSMDETEYLMKSEENKKMLLESIAQVERGEVVNVKIGKGRKK